MSAGAGGRAPVNLCPYCGEEDLRPDEPEDESGSTGRDQDDGWYCRACRRRFAVSYRGMART